MIQPVTYQTTRLLAQGVAPGVLAALEGVKPNTIHVRRLRFEKATGGESTGRHGKRGRPAKGKSPAEVVASLEAASKKRNRRQEVDHDQNRKGQSDGRDEETPVTADHVPGSA